MEKLNPWPLKRRKQIAIYQHDKEVLVIQQINLGEAIIKSKINFAIEYVLSKLIRVIRRERDSLGSHSIIINNAPIEHYKSIKLDLSTIYIVCHTIIQSIQELQCIFVKSLWKLILQPYGQNGKILCVHQKCNDISQQTENSTCRVFSYHIYHSGVQICVNLYNYFVIEEIL